MPSPKDAPPASPFVPLTAATGVPSRPSSRGSPRTPGVANSVRPGKSLPWMADIINRVNLTGIATRFDERLNRGSSSRASTSGPPSPR